MPQELDVYRDWLGVTDAERPLNYYQLLRLKKFEDDIAKIRSNYRKLNAQVRKYAAGQYGERSQQLLNELARAKTTPTCTLSTTWRAKLWKLGAWAPLRCASKEDFPAIFPSSITAISSAP